MGCSSGYRISVLRRPVIQLNGTDSRRNGLATGECQENNSSLEANVLGQVSIDGSIT